MSRSTNIATSSSGPRPPPEDLYPPGPPQAMMENDDPSVVEPARRRLAPKSRFRPLIKLSSCYKSKRSKCQPADSRLDANSSNQSLGSLPPIEQTNDNTTVITLENSSISNIFDNKNEYRWAVVYENQRGLTVFSSPFYSPLSLLPIDPPQFTVPSKSRKQSRQPNISLSNYLLPDGTWHWVSRSWMIDMRTCSGEVQHDGFEYNWFFREKHWHAEIGKLSAGAWVRRRRWVRLMMRPAQHTVKHWERDSSASTSKSKLSEPLGTGFVTLVHPQSDIVLDEIAQLEAAKLEGTEQDWVRCRRLMQSLGRDGRKLELWRIWLCPYLSNSDLVSKGKHPEDDSSSSNPGNHGLNPPRLEHLKTLVQNHGDAILRSFVFPDSRAQLINLIKHAGLARELGRSLGDGFSSTEVDFWSYMKDLEKVSDGGGVAV